MFIVSSSGLKFDEAFGADRGKEPMKRQGCLLTVCRV
jgi:hypothetical protein